MENVRSTLAIWTTSSLGELLNVCTCVDSYTSFYVRFPRKLFVGGLSWDTTSEKMKAHFEQWGEVTDSVIMTDPLSKRPRGFGFVTFKDPDSAVTAVNSADPHILDNKKVIKNTYTVTLI